MKRTNTLKILLYDKVTQDEMRNLNGTLLTENYVEWPDPPSMDPGAQGLPTVINFHNLQNGSLC